MKDRIAKLYAEGRIGNEGLENAVQKGWITESEKQEIMGGN